VPAWWIGVSAALALLSFAAWKAWGVIAMFASLLALVKFVQVAGFIRQGRSVQPPAADPGRHDRVSRCTRWAGAGEPPRSGRLGDRPDPPDERGWGSRRASGNAVLLRRPEGSRVDIYEADMGFPGPQGSVGVEDPPGRLMESYRLCLRTGPTGSNFLVVS
jgi:hypothetical protein